MRKPEGKVKKIYIFAGGTIAENIGEIIFADGDLVIAVDSGAQALFARGIVPDYFLGDFDSIDGKLMDLIKQKYPEQIFAFPAVKNETDSELALLFALKFKPEKILLYGATGTRIDHIMANVNILLQAEEQGVNAVIRDAHNCVQLLLPKRLLHLTKGEYQFLSLLAFSEQVKGLQGTGLKYPLDNLTLMHGSTRGLSNELIEDSATISIDQGVLLVIESKD